MPPLPSKSHNVLKDRMEHLPVISGREAVHAFEQAEWVLQRKSKKGHFILGKPNVFFKLSIPDHKKLDRGLLDALIKDTGLTIPEFRKLLEL